MKAVAVADGPAFRPQSADSEPQKLAHGGPVCGHLFLGGAGAGGRVASPIPRCVERIERDLEVAPAAVVGRGEPTPSDIHLQRV
jgi:hypothetical protein